MRKTMKSLAFLGVVLGLATAAVTTHALTLESTMRLKFSRAVALPGVELNAGTYLFELANPLSDAAIVRVSSDDRRTIYLTAFTHRIQRPDGMRRGQVVTFGEAANGAPPPIAAWFPEGSDRGHEFIYRK